MDNRTINGYVGACVYHIKKLIQMNDRNLSGSVFLLAGFLALFITNDIQANPNISDATIVNGIVTFNQLDGSTLDITNTSGAIIDWNAFSIDAGQRTRFIQESINSRVLNRVTGRGASDILGQLSSNGKVYLINPNGIVFGQGAVVDTAGLVGSTLNISNSDFITGRDRFSGTTGKITNQATLSMTGDGSIVLIAPTIENQGVIKTENGQLILAAGQSVELLSGNVLFEIQASGTSALNLGELITQRGEIGVFTDQLVQAGTIQANQAVQDANGNIILQASSRLDIQAGSTTQNAGGSISLQSEGNTTIAGQVTTSAATAGSITISGKQITISGAVEAMGDNGGNILVGELSQNTDTISVTSTGTIRADAVGNGNGGAVSLLSSNEIEVAGLLSATGGSSAANLGGNIDVFGKQITVSGTMDTSGNNGGNVFIGGDIIDSTDTLQSTDSITVTSSGVIKADALVDGNGGGIIAFAKSALQVQGVFSAQGGSAGGDGGAIVMSGLTDLSFTLAPRLTAANGSTGDWLLVASKLIIDENKASVINNALNSGIKVGLSAQGTDTTTITSVKRGTRDVKLKIGALLGKVSVGDLEINSAISKTTGGEASLDLFGNSLAVNAPIGSSSGVLNVGLLTAQGELSEASTVNINATINTNGGVLTASDGVLALVSAAVTTDSVVDTVVEEVTREAVVATSNVEETSTSEVAEEESIEEGGQESDNETKQEDTKKLSSPQQCNA